MKVKVSEASGQALDWMVAKAEGYLDDPESWMFCVCSNRDMESFRPSVQWGTGGPIIDREDIMFHAGPNRETVMAYLRRTGYALAGCSWGGPDHLIAAMRCFVASKLGDEVEVPEELLT